MSNMHKANEGRKARAEARRKGMLTLAAKGTPDAVIAQELGVSPQTVRNNLVIARKEPLTLMEDNRQEALDELKQLKAEVLSHRKGSKPLPLAAVDRLIKIAEVVMRLEGTAAPTKSISASVEVKLDPATMGMYDRFFHECRGLTSEQFEQVWAFMGSLPRKPFEIVQPPKTSPLWGNEPKQLTGDSDATS